MPSPTLERWRQLWSRLGATGDPAAAFEELERRYREPHRAYHNFDHIGHCLSELDQASPVPSTAWPWAGVELALWFHDAVYDPTAPDNEQRSAALARSLLQPAGLQSDRLDRLDFLILATRHSDPPDGDDARIVVDVDLAILGQSRVRFARFEDEIRAEYSWVPTEQYRKGRSEVLQRFLAREAIFATPHFRRRYEMQARSNLEWALQRLSRN